MYAAQFLRISSFSFNLNSDDGDQIHYSILLDRKIKSQKEDYRSNYMDVDTLMDAGTLISPNEQILVF